MPSSLQHIVCLAPRLLGPVPATLAQALGNTPTPHLEWLLSRGQRIACAGKGSEGLLAERFPALPGVGGILATAHGLGPDSICYRAAPVHLRADRDRLLLFAGVETVLSAEEAGAICADVNALFAEDGLTLRYIDGEWLLLAASPPGPDLPALSEVAGRYLDTVIPMGSASQRWRQLLNEMQMLLHAHPVNQAREAAGLLPVNGLWVWAGGRQAEVAALSALHTWEFMGDSTLIKALGSLVEDPASRLPQSLSLFESAELALMSGDAGGWLAALEAFENNEAAALVRQCKAGQASVELRVGPGMGWHLGHGARWRFWCRARPLRDQIKVQD